MSSLRTCKVCGVEKPLELFANAGTTNGITYRRMTCSKCYTAAGTEKIRDRRKKLDEYKQTLACAGCGTTDHRVLEFHHRDPSEKELEVSLMLNWSWKKMMAEVHKCDVLCANCHRILHYEERAAKRQSAVGTEVDTKESVM